MRFYLIMLPLLLSAAFAGMPDGGGINRNPIHLVAVGYDIENDAAARQMLQDMAQAARDSGALGEVILAGQDHDQLEAAMQRAVAIALQPDTPPAPDRPPAYRLELQIRTARPGDTIAVTHSDFPVTNRNAWIAFYANSADRDQDYLAYTFLLNLQDRLYDVTAPDKPGDEYHFRLFAGEGYDCAARSEPVVVSD